VGGKGSMVMSLSLTAVKTASATRTTNRHILLLHSHCALSYSLRVNKQMHGIIMWVGKGGKRHSPTAPEAATTTTALGTAQFL